MQVANAKKICNFAEGPHIGVMARPKKKAAKWPGRLRELLQDRNKSKVAEILGWPAQRISQMIGREELPNVLDAVALCSYLRTTTEEVFGADIASPGKVIPVAAAARKVKLVGYRIAPGKLRKGQAPVRLGEIEITIGEDFHGQRGLIPIIAPIAAGTAKEAHDKGFPAGTADSYIGFETNDANAFALRVDGDSMSPDFQHGDIIIVSPKVGHANKTFADGMAAVVIFGSERTASFKLFSAGQMAKTGRETLNYLLESINPDFPPMRLKTGEIAAVHPVIGLVRRET